MGKKLEKKEKQELKKMLCTLIDLQSEELGIIIKPFDIGNSIVVNLMDEKTKLIVTKEFNHRFKTFEDDLVEMQEELCKKSEDYIKWKNSKEGK